MKSATQFSLLAVATVSVSLSAWAQGQGIDYAKIEILTEKIAPNLFMLSGSAGADPGHQDAAGRPDRCAGWPGWHLHGGCPVRTNHG